MSPRLHRFLEDPQPQLAGTPWEKCQTFSFCAVSVGHLLPEGTGLLLGHVGVRAAPLLPPGPHSRPQSGCPVFVLGTASLPSFDLNTAGPEPPTAATQRGPSPQGLPAGPVSICAGHRHVDT